MTILYTFDADGIYSGTFTATDIYAPVPPALPTAPPTLSGMQVAQRQGDGWVVLEARPIKPVDPAGVQAGIVASTQLRLDAFARTRNYDGILSACTYATSSVPKFASEGQYAVQARDATWAALYGLLEEVQAGERPVPESFDGVAPLLPALEWPA